MPAPLPTAKSVTVNPPQEQLRAWVLEHMPRIVETEFGNLNYTARILARLTPSTFFVSDVDNGRQRMSRAEAAEWAAKQDAYIAEQDMIELQGYIGPDPSFRTGARLVMEQRNANVVVVLPVPDRPMMSASFSSPSGVDSAGNVFAPECMASPPRSCTKRFHMRRLPIFDSPK